MVQAHSMSMAQQLIPIYNTTMHMSRCNVAFNNVAKLFMLQVKDTNIPQGRVVSSEVDEGHVGLSKYIVKLSD